MIKFKQKIMQKTNDFQSSARTYFKQKIFFICDYNKNYHLVNSYLLIFFIFYQIIPLNFILQRVALQNGPNSSTTSFLLNSFNNVSLLIASSLISDIQLQIYLVISFLILLLFTLVYYSALTIQIQRRTRLRKDTLKKLEIIQQISFLILMFQLPIGVFCVNYLIFLVNLQEWYLIMLPILILAVCVISIYLIEEFSNQNNYSKIVYLSRVHVRYQGAMAVFKFIVKIGIVLLIQNNYSTTIVFLSAVLMLIIDLVELELFIEKVRFLDVFTLFLVEIRLILSVIIQFFCLIVIATQSKLLIDNLFISILSTTALAVFSLHKHQNYDRQQLLLTDISSISNEEDATKVMIEYLKFFEDKNANKVFLLALVQVHKSKCQQCSCICKSTESKAMNHSAWIDFFHKFVLLTLANICFKFPRSLKVIAVYLNFQIHFMHSFSTIHFAVARFMKQYGRQLTSSDEFAFQQIKRDVEENTDLFNQNSLVIDLEIVFKEELLQKQLRKLIDNINVNNFKKYSMIQQQFCKLNKVQILCDQITRDIRKIQSHWSAFRKSTSFNMKIYEVFLVYNQSIIMSKSTFSDVKTEMITKLQAVRGLRGVSPHNLAKYVHNKNACVIESQVIEDNIGHITNVSHRCENVFRMTKEKMKGNNIHNIMTNFIGVSHEKMVREWMQAERLSNILKKIINVVYVGGNNNCFQGSIFMKIKSDGSLLTFYAILIKQNQEDYLVLNQDMIIQGFGRRLQSQRVFSLACIGTKFKDFCSLNLIEELNTKSSIKKKILIKDKCLRTSNSISDSKSFKNIAKKQYFEGESYFHECSVLISKQQLGTYIYYSIKFLQINKIIRRRTFISNLSRHKLKSQAPIIGTNPLQEAFQQIKISKAISSFQTIDKDDREGQVQAELIGQNMSVSSCFTGGELNIKLNKIFIISKEKVVDSTTIQDERVPATTFVIVLLSLLLIFAAVGVCQIFNAGFSTYQAFLTANGAVSNSYNLLEIVYNDIMTAGLYCNTSNPIQQQQRCNFLLQSGLDVASEFYTLIVDDFRNYLAVKPSLTSLNYYEVFQMNATFQLDSQNISLTARQFMQQFYYLLQQTGKQMKLQISNQQFKVEQKLKLLLTNWQTLRIINHKAIDFYNEAGLNQIRLITRYMVVVIAFMYILMVLLILSWRSFKNYIEGKKQNIARVHGIITSSQCEQLKKAVVVSFNSQIFEQPTRVIKPVGKPSYLTKNQFIYHKDKTFRYFLAPFFLLLTALNLPLLIHMAQLLPSSQQLMQIVSDLLASEKLVLENYQQLKNAYFFGNSSQFNVQIKALIKQMSQQIQPKINSVAKDIRDTLSSDPNFSRNINKLFNDDVCTLNNGDKQLNYFNQYCGQGNTFGILPQGLISTATLIQRQTYSTLLQFSQHVFVNSSYMDKQLNESTFYKIDDYQIYLSRVYKKIQNQIIASLELLINQTYSTLILFSVLEIIALTLGILIWVVSVRREKDVLSNLYGVVLQFPQALLQDNRWHIKTIEENLKFDL